MARDLYPGMGVAVAERTVLRRKSGGFESWQDVASRVAFGNSSLCANAEERISEYELLKNYIADGKLLTSGRHLQHGDISQQDRNGEVFSNCSTSISTFGLVYLLLNGSGVGRCYDDDLMLVDWDNAPNVLCVLDHRHPDFDYTIHETLRDAKHKYDGNRNVIWHAVEDSREGWANAVEYLETLAYQKVNRDKLLVLDFSNVRGKNSPIGGMQGRPSSGPVPLMNAFARVTSIKGAGMAPWKQAMYIDHYFAEVVLMGGVRRCLPKGTQVKVPTGHTPIENIKVGDEICTLKGTKKVTATFYQGIQDTVLIEHQFGTFECTGNHRVAVYRTSNSYEFIFAGSLKPGDRLVFDPTVCPGTKTELPPAPDKQKSRFDTNSVSWVLPELDTDIAWLLGILQGDGYIAVSSEGKGSVSLKIASTYPEILKSTLNKLMLCFRKFGLIPTIADYRPEENAVGIKVFSTSFAHYLQSWLKKPNTDMQVPDCISRGTPEIRWAYLSGLFDADGSSRTPPVSLLCSVYPGFVDSVMLCYQSLGVAVRSNWARRPNGWKDIAKITTKSMEHILALNTQFPKYSTKFKPSNHRFSTGCHTFPAYWNEFSIGESREKVYAFSLERWCKGLPVTVRSVTPSGRKVQTYDIEVADIHQFTANGLVVHNSARLAVKHWKDASILEYIQVKRPVEFLDKPAEEVQELRKFNPRSFLWSSNNSVGVDSEFWNLVHAKRNSKATKSELYRHAMRVFKMVTECAYYDGTGEPGFINLDQLVSNSANLDMIKGDYFQSNRYTLLEDTSLYLEKLLKIAKLKQFCMIANPCGEVPLAIWGGFCVSGNTRIAHRNGYDRIVDLVGKAIEVWNGETWSTVKPFKTGTHQPLLRVTFEDGSVLDCTSQHKFSVRRSRQSKIWDQVVAGALKPGDILPCFSLDHDIVGNRMLTSEAYTYGVFLCNGHIEKQTNEAGSVYENYIELYGQKANLPVLGVKTLSNKDDTVSVSVSFLNRYYLMQLKEIGLPDWVYQLNYSSTINFIRGWLDADGCLCSDGGFQITSIDLEKCRGLQLLLRRIGINFSTVRVASEKTPVTNTVYAVYIPNSEAAKLNGFRVKTNRVPNPERIVKQPRVKSVEPLKGLYDTFCFTEPERNMGVFNNVLTYQCFIGDIVPYHCDTLEECEPVARAMTRFLIRTNKLDSVYSKEVKRTNRIGGALTGIQEFAAKFWGFNFFDLIDEQKSLPFWMTLSRMRRAIRDEAVKYCKIHNLPAPHTDVVIKPSGSVSKLFGLTEGWHLPAMPFYLRWVQFKDTDPLVEEYRSRGYPFRVLTTYKNSVIIGFPTSLEITKLLPPDRLVTASQATPEQQYKWLMLGEKYWIRGVDENGKPLSTDTGGQISYTLKYDPSVVSYKEFCDKIAEFQPKVKCCSVMPEVSNNGAYEYLPEEAITAEEFERIKSNIRESAVSEDVSYEHVDCAGGNCPVDFKTTK